MTYIEYEDVKNVESTTNLGKVFRVGDLIKYTPFGLNPCEKCGHHPAIRDGVIHKLEEVTTYIEEGRVLSKRACIKLEGDNLTIGVGLGDLKHRQGNIIEALEKVRDYTSKVMEDYDE